MTPNDRPDWSTPGTASATVQSIGWSLIRTTTTATGTFNLLFPSATQQVELHRVWMQSTTTGTTATIKLMAGGGTALVIWHPRKASTGCGSVFQFDFEGALLPQGDSLQLVVITTVPLRVSLEVVVNYVFR